MEYFNIDNIYALVYGYGEGADAKRFGRKFRLFFEEDGNYYSLRTNEKLSCQIGEFNKDQEWGKYAEVSFANQYGYLVRLSRYFNDLVDFNPVKFPIILACDNVVPRVIKQNSQYVSSRVDLLKYENEYNIAIDNYYEKCAQTRLEKEDNVL